MARLGEQLRRLGRTVRGERDSADAYRRARTLRETLGVTALGALLPGAGFLWTGRRRLGLVVLVPSVLLALAAFWYVARDLQAMLQLAFRPDRLRVAAAVLLVVFAAWILVVASTYLMVRPAQRTRSQSTIGVAFVAALCILVAAPTAVAVRYATVQADLITEVFEDNVTATAPTLAPGKVLEANPWGDRNRVNVLLLGGDGAVHRDGVRTDSVILMSIDVETGRTVMFSLPRNLMNAQFPPGSPLHELYPNGFTGPGDPAAYMLNAIYGQVPAQHPRVLGHSANEGADAVKQAVEGTLGIPVHYYVLVNLRGFQEIVDAMGGVTVNINEPVPVGGWPARGIPPHTYLQPGPDQRLNGHDALWFARGRYGSDDYQRMERQRCMVRAIIDEARPLTLLRHYQELAATGKKIVRSDIPSELLPAFADLALLIKKAEVRSVVFRSSDRFYPGDPDIPWMRTVVHRALDPDHRPRRRGAHGPGRAEDATASCAYHPEQ